jgi:hypothetical protein
MKPQKPRKISPALQKRLLRNLERLIQSGQIREGLRLLQEQQGVGSDTLQKIQKAISDGIRMGAWQAESHRRAREIAEQWLAAGDDEPGVQETVPTAQQKNKEPFSQMPDLRWDDITITFVSNDSVKIQARNKAKTFLYADLGFRDARKGDLPTKAWDFLELLAEKGGQIDFNTLRSSRRASLGERENSEAAQCFNAKNKIRVRELRKKLRTFFGIKADPFYSYKKCLSYKPIFSLKDERP